MPVAKTLGGLRGRNKLIMQKKISDNLFEIQEIQAKAYQKWLAKLRVWVEGCVCLKIKNIYI